MKSWLVQLFSANSTVSAMRVMSLMCVVSAVGLGWYGILENRDLVALSVLCGTFLTAGFTGKAVQKSQELKSHEEQLGETVMSQAPKSAVDETSITVPPEPIAGSKPSDPIAANRPGSVS